MPAQLSSSKVSAAKVLPSFDGTLPYFADVQDGTRRRAYRAAHAAVASRPKLILFAWELGAGLGHLMQMLPLASDLVKAGHCAYVVLRDLTRATSVFGRAGVSFFQAPAWTGGMRYPEPATYTQLLANIGFGSYDVLFARASAWHNLFRLAKPDLIVFDHAPTALLASRGIDVRRVLIGSGFCCPPDVTQVDDGEQPWAVLRPEAAEAEEAQLHEHEAELLGYANRVLAGWKQPPLERLGQLYSEVDENLLTTLPELDHFQQRRGAGYWGPVICDNGGGEVPIWPEEGEGKRVFAYLKHFDGVEALLSELNERRCPTLAYIDGGVNAELRRHESATLRLAKRRLDVALVAEQCDVAILNGGHGVSAQMLLAGRPVMEIPLAMEQRLLSSAVARMGAGVAASARREDSIEGKLDELLSGECDAAAGEFAARYAAFEAGEQRRAMLGRVMGLVA